MVREGPPNIKETRSRSPIKRVRVSDYSPIKFRPKNDMNRFNSFAWRHDEYS